jgi:ketosteroid isomerase-like protein
METILDTVGTDGTKASMTRRATYVFKRSTDNKWLCVIDNSYGTDLLNA